MSQPSCLIFLDIDGVLNRHHISEADLMLDDETLIDTSHDLHPSLYIPCLNNLKYLLDTLGPDAKIVIASSWRDDQDLVAFLVKAMNNLFGEELMKDRIIGDTNQELSGSRTGDIYQWMEEHVAQNSAPTWIAIDDTAHNLRSVPVAFQHVIHDRVGLTENDVETILTKLADQKKK